MPSLAKLKSSAEELQSYLQQSPANNSLIGFDDACGVLVAVQRASAETILTFVIDQIFGAAENLDGGLLRVAADDLYSLTHRPRPVTESS